MPESLRRKKEKIEKYQDLKRIRQLWNVKTIVLRLWSRKFVQSPRED